MRVAVLGVSHWHVPMYLEYLGEMEEVEVVAVSDPSEEAVRRAQKLAPGARDYRDYRELLDAEQVELVLAHAPHDAMTPMAAELVARRIPFHMEKPMGMRWDELAQVAAQAAEAKLFVSVPLVSRFFGVVGKLLEEQENGRLGDPIHFSFRLFAGPPQRYVDAGVAWMLDAQRAGAGPLFNFGPHAIDLFLAITGAQARRVRAWASYRLYGLGIPDIVSFVIEADAGCYGVCEVSYTKHEDYERYLSVVTTRIDYGGLPDVGTIAFRDGMRISVDGPTSDEAYRLYLHDLIKRVEEGREPLVGIDQMVVILRILNAVQRSLAERRAVEV